MPADLSAKLVTRSSNIHRTGCYTTVPFAEGDYICRYDGELLTKEEADERFEGQVETYLFGLGDGSFVIHGTGVSRYINHSCDPNCESDENDGEVWIIALKDIAAGEELTYDYNLYDGDEDDEAVCMCGSAECRGSMYSPEELEARAKAKTAALAEQKKKLRQENELLNRTGDAGEGVIGVRPDQPYGSHDQNQDHG
ncbi:MAG: SET domain-containing protein-lysine N-methyltransferase [Acidobacteriales bacterium]|nr:SET domain-containing protein-lysine N-methyltransferase [Terriglobales bacterium]